MSAVTLARVVRGAAIALALSSLGGCLAAGASAENMVVLPSSSATAMANAATPDMPSFQKLKVSHVQGGEETNPILESDVSNEDFRVALENSLRNLSYLAPDGGAYEVTASIVNLDRPLIGLDFSVTVTIRYTITPVGGGAPVFDDTVATTGVGRFADSPIGVMRMKLANEKAVQANIEEFTRRLKASWK